MPSARRVRGLIEEDAGLLTRITVPRPRACTFSPGDWEILGRYWHTAVFSRDVAGTPVKVKRLDAGSPGGGLINGR